MNDINPHLRRIGSVIFDSLAERETLALCNDEAIERKIIGRIMANLEEVKRLQRANRKLYKKIEKLSQLGFPF